MNVGKDQESKEAGSLVVKDFFLKLLDLTGTRQPFAVATVIQIEGSASAKPGSKAIIDSKGKLLLGWVGGGCAEGAVRQEALQSIQDGKTRIITLDLTDELLGVGMPCGGLMKVYIEPVLPKPDLVVVGHGRIAETLVQLAYLADFSVTVVDPMATKESFPAASRLMTEAGGLNDIPAGPETYVVIATQHKGDHLAMQKAILGRARYIALIASRKRSQLVLDYLVGAGVPRKELARVHAPAGLDIGAQTPEEIALSIVGEIVAVRRGGSGRPLLEVAGVKLTDKQVDLDQITQTLNTCAPITTDH